MATDQGFESVMQQLDAALLENARLRRLAESRRERIEAITASTRCTHMTRDVKPIGQCPGCDMRARLLEEIERLRRQTISGAAEGNADEVTIKQLRVEVEHLRGESDGWFNAYNELRDAGDPSWDMFDATVASAVYPYEELRIALSNFMDKPWSSADWWTPVRVAFFALSPDWSQEEGHFEDPYLLGKHHGILEERAGVWTQEELDEIQERARVRAAELAELVDEG